MMYYNIEYKKRDRKRQVDRKRDRRIIGRVRN